MRDRAGGAPCQKSREHSNGYDFVWFRRHERHSGQRRDERSAMGSRIRQQSGRHPKRRGVDFQCRRHRRNGAPVRRHQPAVGRIRRQPARAVLPNRGQHRGSRRRPLHRDLHGYPERSRRRHSRAVARYQRHAGRQHRYPGRRYRHRPVRCRCACGWWLRGQLDPSRSWRWQRHPHERLPRRWKRDGIQWPCLSRYDEYRPSFGHRTCRRRLRGRLARVAVGGGDTEVRFRRYSAAGERSMHRPS